MGKTRFHFVTIVKAEYEHQDGAAHSTAVAGNVRFEVSKNLDQKNYLMPDGTPKEPAIKPTTLTLLTGIVANVRYADKMGWWKKEDHLAYILEQLNRLDQTPGDTELSTMEY